MVDAVDESADPGSLLRELLVPLAHSGARVAVAGLRRRVRLQPSEAVWVDLDQPPFRDEQALVEYVRRRLAGGGVYPDEDEARLVAAAVGQAADGLFLVAEVVARTLARSPVDTSVPGWEARLPRDATEAFAEYLERFDDQRRRVLALLHPLALARGDGLDLDPGTLWLTAADALRPRDLAPFVQDDLYRARRQADDYLLATGEGESVRLFHEALAEAVRVLAARERLEQQGVEETAQSVGAEIERAALKFLDSMLALLPAADAPAAAYQHLAPYLFEQLPAHLADAGRAAELLQRPGFLLVAEQEQLRQALVRAAGMMPAELEPARIAAVHALARPAEHTTIRAAALCAALRRQRHLSLAARVGSALTGDSDGETLPPI